MHTMTSETVAAHTQPILKEVSQLTMQVRDLAEMVRGLAGEVREIRGEVCEVRGEVREIRGEVREIRGEVRNLAKTVAAHDRKLDVLAAQMRLMLGAFGLLITALIAVFGILFTR